MLLARLILCNYPQQKFETNKTSVIGNESGTNKVCRLWDKRLICKIGSKQVVLYVLYRQFKINNNIVINEKVTKRMAMNALFY